MWSHRLVASVAWQQPKPRKQELPGSLKACACVCVCVRWDQESELVSGSLLPARFTL